jgi:hypothetical protein
MTELKQSMLNDLLQGRLGYRPPGVAIRGWLFGKKERGETGHPWSAALENRSELPTRDKKP